MVQVRYSRTILRFLCSLALVTAAVAQAPQAMPKIEGESLSGRTVALPEASKGKVALLIFGFTKASKEPTRAWAEKIFADFGTQPGFELYQLPVLEDVPRFVRGMVISGIKKGIPENMRDHFVPILQGEADLKKLVGYKEPDDAYLVVLDRAGKIVTVTHGPLRDANYSRLRAEVQSFMGSPE